MGKENNFNREEENYFLEIKQIEEKIDKICKKFSSSFPKTINSKEEKKRFFNALKKNEIYNPQLIFEEDNLDETIVKKLKGLKIETRNDIYGFKKLYKEKINFIINQFYIQKYWGDTKSTNYSIKLYKQPSGVILRKAIRFCKDFKREKVKFTKITPQILAKELKAEVKLLTGENIKVKFTDLANKVNINKNLVKINPEKEFTTLDLKRLKVHEIGTHFMRYYNGKKTGIKILEEGVANYIKIEEGLAAFMEDKKQVLSKAQMFIYAGRVIATYYTTRKSFYDIYHILKKFGFKDQDAYAITYRAKRNLYDTSQKGGFTKDYVYFEGYFILKKFARIHDITDLFIGKIRIKDIKTLKKFIEKYKENLNIHI